MSVHPQASLADWTPPTLGELLRWRIPERKFTDRCLIRGLTLLGRSQIARVCGLEHIDPANDPFIIALNHGTRRESLLVPAILMLYRGGRFIHFMADWNYRLIPGIGLIYRRAQTITVTRKSAKPRVFNFLKPLYRKGRLTVIERTRARLLAGMPIGIFPEGRVNPDRDRLLKGRIGAAYLSLETGVPVIPVGHPLAGCATWVRHAARPVGNSHRSSAHAAEPTPRRDGNCRPACLACGDYGRDRSAFGQGMEFGMRGQNDR